ncbi:MAG: hypothetical protein U5L11_00920 [Arhodomonas sp.]|nr:hypothetical protein [Arhodomonas sp.]
MQAQQGGLPQRRVQGACGTASSTTPPTAWTSTPQALIERCAEEIRDNLRVGKARFVTRTARLDVNRGGVEAEAVQRDRRHLRCPGLPAARHRRVPPERDQSDPPHAGGDPGTKRAAGRLPQQPAEVH